MHTTTIETIKTKWAMVFGKVQMIALQKVTSVSRRSGKVSYLVNGQEFDTELEANYQFDMYKDLSQ